MTVLATPTVLSPPAHHPSPSFQELKIPDDRLRSPLPLRCVVLLRRDIGETWNAWVENWAEKGRAYLLFATQTMKVRRFHPTQTREQWQFVEGPWKMYIIEAASMPLGSRIDRTQFTDALQGFTRCKRYQFEHHPLPAHTHTPDTGHLQHDELWRQWDEIAHARAQLLAQFPCPWDSVAATLVRSNRPLLKCLDRRLRRIARLSHLADFEDLNEEDRFIYVISGPFAPYVGQTGCITTAWSLMQRYKEHLSRAKALNKHFQGPKRRRYRKLFAFGKLHSLGRLLARNGPAPATIFPLQKVKPDTHGGQLERWWVRVLAPTLNKVLPFGGLDRLRCKALLQQKQSTPQNRTLTASIQDILNAQGQGYSAEHALALATEAMGHVGHELFVCFFHCVQNLAKAAWGIPLSRRVLIRIPCYDEQVIKEVQYTLKRSLFCTNLPLVVSTWYAQALTVLPDLANTVAAATRPMARPSTPLRVARLLSTNQVALQARQHVVHCSDKPLLKYATLPDPHAWKPLGQAMLEKQRHCACAYLQRQYALLQNYVGHLVLRHPWQWGLVISKSPPYLMGRNTRSKVLHSSTSVEPAMQRLLNNLQKKITPQ